MTGKNLIKSFIRYMKWNIVLFRSIFYWNIVDTYFLTIYYHADGEKLDLITEVNITGIGLKVEDMDMERQSPTFSEKKKQVHLLITTYTITKDVLANNILLFEILPKATQMFAKFCHVSKIIQVIGEKMRRMGLE